MKFVKLKEYCKNNSISYASGNRWFHDGQIPGAYQTGSGTILVPCEEPGDVEKGDSAISMFLKKTVEFSKNEGSLEDFAAWVLSTFSLKLQSDAQDSPKYSKVRPKPEDIQNHFKQFIPKGEKPKPYIMTSDELKDVEKTLEDEKASTINPAADPASAPTNQTNATGIASELANLFGQSDTFISTTNSVVPIGGLISGTYLPTNVTTYIANYDGGTSGANQEVSLNFCRSPFASAAPIITTNVCSSFAGDTAFVETNSTGTTLTNQPYTPDVVGLYLNQTNETEKSHERSKIGRKPASYYKDKGTK